MDIVAPFYTSQTPRDLGKLLLSSSAFKQHEGDVSINIYDHYIMETSSKGKAYIPLDFDLKYAFQMNPPSVVFEKSSERYMFSLRNESDLQQWR